MHALLKTEDSLITFNAHKCFWSIFFQTLANIVKPHVALLTLYPWLLNFIITISHRTCATWNSINISSTTCVACCGFGPFAVLPFCHIFILCFLLSLLTFSLRSLLFFLHPSLLPQLLLSLTIFFISLFLVFSCLCFLRGQQEKFLLFLSWLCFGLLVPGMAGHQNLCLQDKIYF